jgi:hypothetical protein
MVGHRRAVDELHGHERRGGVVARVGSKDLGDAGMLKLSEQIGLDLETPPRRSRGQATAQDLHRDGPSRARLQGRVDDAGRARGEDALDGEVAQPRAGRHRGVGVEQGGRIQERLGRLERADQRLDFPAQLGIVAALFRQPRVAVGWRNGSQRQEEGRRAGGRASLIHGNFRGRRGGLGRS